MRVECPSARSRDEAPASLFLFAQTMKRIVACVLVALAALAASHSPTLAELLQVLRDLAQRGLPIADIVVIVCMYVLLTRKA